jgi:2-polyprenyl-3-methyl-5-hydroxy-6-metoxy-1,4-benzoquinol methylase
VVGTASAGVKRLYEDIWAALPDELEIPDREVREEALARLPFDAGARVLDLGCGAGHFTRLLAERGAAVTAADVAGGALKRTARAEPRAVTALIEPHGPWPFGDDEFAAVWCSETIEHVADVERWLGEIRRVTRPGAQLAFTTPNHGRVSTALALLRTGPEAVLDPRSDHLRFFSAASLRDVLERAGFAAVTTRRAGHVLIATCAS